MKKYVCLRDDDNNYFTRIEDFEKGYGEFWGKAPVTLATVPFSHGSQQKVLEFQNDIEGRDWLHRNWQKNATAEELTAYHRVYPIGENTQLVEALKPLVRSEKVEIAQHGVFHRYNERGPEMFSNEMAFEAIRDGKEYLEKVFETEVKFFVPPSNTIDKTCVGYLNRLGMNLFSSGEIYKDNSHVKTYDLGFRLHSLKNHLLRRPSEPMRRVWGIMKFGSVTFNKYKTQDEVYKLVCDQLHRTGFAGLGTHYMSFFRDGYAEDFQNLLRRLRDEEDVEFVMASDYYHLIYEKYYE